MKMEVCDMGRFLREQREDIDHVRLTWLCTPYYFEEECHLLGESEGPVIGEMISLCHRFKAKHIDRANSFSGNVDDAIDFVESHGGIWNDVTIRYRHGIVVARHVQEYEEGRIRDISEMDSGDYTDILYCGLVCRPDDVSVPYKGKLFKRVSDNTIIEIGEA